MSRKALNVQMLYNSNYDERGKQNNDFKVNVCATRPSLDRAVYEEAPNVRPLASID